VETLIRVGDTISFVGAPTPLLNNLVSGKAMDNRASVAAVLSTLEHLQQLHHQWDVYAVATANEEHGSYVGATTQAYEIRPDIAIVLDVTFADVDEVDISLGNGPVISQGPSNNQVIRTKLVELCEQLELKYQTEIMASGAGTDAYAIEVSRAGVPTILVSVPSRYMHSPVEVVSIKDIERTGRLLAHFIAGLDASFLEALVPKID
jgi:putative aminopeptidase FrvX